METDLQAVSPWWWLPLMRTPHWRSGPNRRLRSIWPPPCAEGPTSAEMRVSGALVARLGTMLMVPPTLLAGDMPNSSAAGPLTSSMRSA